MSCPPPDDTREPVAEYMETWLPYPTQKSFPLLVKSWPKTTNDFEKNSVIIKKYFTVLNILL